MKPDLMMLHAVVGHFNQKRTTLFMHITDVAWFKGCYCVLYDPSLLVFPVCMVYTTRSYFTCVSLTGEEVR